MVGQQQEIGSYPGLMQIRAWYTLFLSCANLSQKRMLIHLPIIDFSRKSVKIQRMREQCVPGPFVGSRLQQETKRPIS